MKKKVQHTTFREQIKKYGKVNWEEWKRITEEIFGEWLKKIPDDSKPIDNMYKTFTNSISKTQEELSPHKKINSRKYHKPC